MALPAIMRRLFAGDGYGPLLKDDIVSKRISIQDWSSSFDYQPATAVRGSDGKPYWSVAASGPNSGGAANPVNDGGAHWVSLPSMADIAAMNYATQSWVGSQGYATQSWVGAQGYAPDSGVVHTTGSETIAGNKTFTDAMFFGYTNADVFPLCASRTDLLMGGSLNFDFFVGMRDKNFNRISDVIFEYANNINKIGFHLFHQSAPELALLFQFKNSSASVGYFSPAIESNDRLNLGDAGKRWSTVYATNGIIDVSDERLKTLIASIPDEVLDAWGDVGFVQYKMNSAVKEKGSAARLHSGIIAQRIDRAFASRGLDASKYGLFCYDSWEAEPEKRDETGKVVQPAREAGNEFSLRYGEALCMEAAYQRRRADRAEARIASLEARLAALEAKLNG